MFVSFDFECPIHGIVEQYFSTMQYPDRDFPKIIAGHCFKTKPEIPPFSCDEICERLYTSTNFIQDSIGVSPADDKRLVQMDKLYNSKSYLKRDLKSHGMEALTIEEHKTRKFKSTEEKHLEHFNRPDVTKERHNKLSEAIDSLGVIDKLKEN